jgi:predicted secreted Zn-dependent protease
VVEDGRETPAAVPPRSAAPAWAALAVFACSANVLDVAPREPAPVRIAYYPVQGRSVAEIRRDLARNGPRDRAGQPRAALTDWSLGWRYALRREPNACVATQLETPLAITTTLPSLSTPVPEHVHSQWSALEAALAEHEHGHRRIALECRDELSRRLAAVASASDCAALRRALDHTGRAALAECRARDDGFDRATNHGAGGAARR